MHKALSAVLAAGLTASILATNGQIVTDASAYVQQHTGLDMSLPSLQLNLSRAEIEAYMQNPAQWLALLQSMWEAGAPNVQDISSLGFSSPTFDGFHADSVPYAGNRAFFGGFSSGEIHDLYEEAYPGYHDAMASYRQPSPTYQSPGLLQGLSNGLGGNSPFGLGGGLMGFGNPGYVSQSEFNDIVFD